ncbi:MAG TPA: M28 family peptidase [Blastocatellia bacterium]|nr:M28 family peptidase [Blastocatellia bacterium]
MFRRNTLRRCMLSALFLALFSIAFGAAGQSVVKQGPVTGARKANPPVQFDAARAYRHVKKLVEIGPRPPGSEAIREASDYVVSELRSYGLKVTEDKFQAETTRGQVAMNNLVAELKGKRSETVLIAGHYDTKPQAGFVGANDGGSSTAAVLEMARVLAKTKPDYTLWFVFFDGEEAFVDWNANNGMDNTYGSRHMVKKLAADGVLSQVKAMVLVDMIGDMNLDLLRDVESTLWMVNAIWRTARQLGYAKHFLEAEGAYSDDHIAFKNAGVPVVDLIDFNYGPGNRYWHTNDDSLDKVSGESMKVVGDVVIASLPEIFKQLDVRNGKN